MPRVAGVDIPGERILWVALTRIYGIGPSLARKVCNELAINSTKHARELSEDEISRLNAFIEERCTVEGQLRQRTAQDISRLKRIQCYRGIRHIKGLPVRGQRTRTNARTRKGKRKTVAGKRGVKELHT